jgi:DNA repair exonuclease SbcCD ATPase subunit
MEDMWGAVSTLVPHAIELKELLDRLKAAAGVARRLEELEKMPAQRSEKLAMSDTDLARRLDRMEKDVKAVRVPGPPGERDPFHAVHAQSLLAGALFQKTMAIYRIRRYLDALRRTTREIEELQERLREIQETARLVSEALRTLAQVLRGLATSPVSGIFQEYFGMEWLEVEEHIGRVNSIATEAKRKSEDCNAVKNAIRRRVEVGEANVRQFWP